LLAHPARPAHRELDVRVLGILIEEDDALRAGHCREKPLCRRLARSKGVLAAGAFDLNEIVHRHRGEAPNLKFGFYFLHLVSQRLFHNLSLASQQSDEADEAPSPISTSPS